MPVKGIPLFCEIPTHKVIIKFVNVNAGMDKYSQTIFKDRGTSHIYWQTDLSQQNQLQYQWSHSTSKEKLCEVKNMFIKLPCLVSGGFIAYSRFGNAVWSKLDA